MENIPVPDPSRLTVQMLNHEVAVLRDAQKEATVAQNAANEAAISKSEAATAKELDGIKSLLAANTKAADDKIADLKTANCLLEELVSQDSLTGLANRRRFEELLQTEHRRANRSVSPLSLVAIDVDHFKAFNDTYGHPAGDDCLKALAKAIEGALRRPGDLAARIGGEEFSVLLPATDALGATFMATSIRDAVLELAIPHMRSETGIVTISIGVATTLPLDESSLTMLVRAADDALYAAKRSGRNAIESASVKGSPGGTKPAATPPAS